MRKEACLFCDIQTNDQKRIVSENELAYAVRDGFPVTEGHTLIIPKRHVLDFFGLTEADRRGYINTFFNRAQKALPGKPWRPKAIQ